MLFRQLFDRESSTYTYLLADENSREAVLVDPVREQVERDLSLLNDLDLKLVYTLETHVHADHVTSSAQLREKTGSRTIVSHRAGPECADIRVHEGELITFGAQALRVLETPGHTDGCLSFVHDTQGLVFTGDTLLIRGCGRTDFQQGNPHAMYASLTQKLFKLPPPTRVYPAHDYRGFSVSTIEEEQRLNTRVAGKTEAEFVALMNDLKLAPPRKIHEAVPANLACGEANFQSSAPPRESHWAPVERNAEGVPEVSVAWLEHQPTRARVVDVREPDEYWGELGHLQGSELVPLATLERAASHWDVTQPLVLLCRSGKRSATAATQLERIGFTSVASLRGGMLEWRRQQSAS